MTHDHILFESKELIDLTQSGRIGQNPGGVLERSRRDKALRFKRSLGDAEQHRGCFRGLPPLGFDVLVCFLKGCPIHLLSP